MGCAFPTIFSPIPRILTISVRLAFMFSITYCGQPLPSFVWILVAPPPTFVDASSRTLLIYRTIQLIQDAMSSRR